MGIWQSPVEGMVMYTEAMCFMSDRCGTGGQLYPYILRSLSVDLEN
jgi:hypothetical protein